jgi:hypothetical protein
MAGLDQRLLHGYFGMSTFFITQNGAAKGGIRFSPTLIALIQQQHAVNQKNTSHTTGNQNRTRSRREDVQVDSPPQFNAISTHIKTGASATMAFAYASILRWLRPISVVAQDRFDYWRYR